MNVEISLILQSEEEEGTNEKKINPILLINACSFTSFFFFCFQQRNQSSPVSHILFLPILLSSF